MVIECMSDEFGGHTLAILMALGSKTQACDEDVFDPEPTWIGDCVPAPREPAPWCDSDIVIGYGRRASLVAGFVRDDPTPEPVLGGVVHMTRCVGGSFGYSEYNAGESGVISLTNEPGSDVAQIDIDVDGLTGSFQAEYCPLAL